jgi:hypothetical protein
MALGVAASIAGGCAVERTTAVVFVGTSEDAGVRDGASIDAPSTDAASDAADTSPDASDGAAAADSGRSCLATDAACTVSNTGCAVGSYFLLDNQWNCGAGAGGHCGPESAYGCTNGDGTVSFVVTSEQAAASSTVLSYPAMQEQFNDVAIGSFHAITSTFSETGPRDGVHEFAYDLWFNGVAMPSSTQILVWVDTYGRVPAGTKVATTTLGGRTYDVWRTADGLHVVFEATASFSSGTVDLLGIVAWTVLQSWLPSTSTLGQIEFGVEIASTAGAGAATYQVDGFSITTN